MVYPAESLGHRIRIAPGADLSAHPDTYPWVDITGHVDFSVPITSTVGAADEEAETNSSLTFTLRNPDGEWTTDNPAAPYYPEWDLNCPIEWSIDLGDGAGWRRRTVQYLSAAVDEWPSNTPFKAVTRVTAAGLFRRLGQQSVPAPAITRTQLGINFGSIRGYWPLDDAAGSTSAASALPGGASMRPQPGGYGVPTFGAESEVAGARSLATFEGMQGLAAPLTVGPNGFQLNFLLRTDGYVSATPFAFIDITTSGGTRPIWRLVLKDGAIYLEGAGGPGDNIGMVIYEWQHVRGTTWYALSMRQVNPTQVDWTFSGWLWSIDPVTGAASPSPIGVSGNFAGQIGSLTGIQVNNGGGGSGPSKFQLGQLILREQNFGPENGFAAVVAWAGNFAAERIVGMSNEFKIPSSLVGTNAESERMGPQLDASVLANLRDSAKADHGVLTDHLGVVGYRTRAQLYNLTPTVTIDGSARELGPAPLARDDQGKRNRVTASRVNGGSYTVEDAIDIARTGLYESTSGVDSLNVALDEQLPDHAGWGLAQGTMPGKRLPSLGINLLVSPQLAQGWLSTQPGDRLRLINPPRQARQQSVDYQVRGWTETAGPGRRRWSAQLNLTRADHYDAWTLDQDRLDSDRTTLVLPATSTATTLLTSTGALDPGSMPITTALHPAEFPVDLDVAGEQVRLTANVAAPITDTFTRTVAAGWGTTTGTGGAYAWLPVDGTTGTINATDANVTAGVGRIGSLVASATRSVALDGPMIADPDVSVLLTFPALPTGGNLLAGIGGRGGTGNAGRQTWYVELRPNGDLFAYFLAGAPVSNLVGYLPTGILYTAGLQIGLRFQAVGTTLRGKVWAGNHAAEPPGWTGAVESPLSPSRPGRVSVRYGTGVGLTNPVACRVDVDELKINNVQQMTVTRSLNGIIKAQRVGAAITLRTQRKMVM